MRFRSLWFGALLLCLASPLAAQTVINPGSVEFDASSDHDRTVGTIPVVDHYELKIVATTATGTVLSVVQLGKPPIVNGHVSPISIKGDIQALASNVYQATVSAVGPDGSEGVSLPTDPFVRITPPAPGGKPSLKK